MAGGILAGVSLASPGRAALRTKAADTAPSDRTARIVALAQQQKFNGAILLKRGGDILFNRAFGKANLQFGVPNGPATRYKIASVTKLFTAVLILQQVGRGRLDLDGVIGDYLPDYTGEGARKVRLRHLLTDTSGLPDFGRDEAVYFDKLTPAEIVRDHCSGPLSFAPGSKWNYNNADFFLLGAILEAVLGQSYAAVLGAQILTPLGLHDTGLAASNRIIPRLAYSYNRDRDSGALTNDDPYRIENYGAAGAIYSSPADLLTFSDALYGGRLIAPVLLKQLLTPYLANYGFGLWIYEGRWHDRPVRVAERQGSIQGTGARLIRLPDDDVTLILLTNIWPDDMNAVRNELIAIATE